MANRWYPDPAGRHRLRYRNAEQWTAWVADDNGVQLDPEWPTRTELEIDAAPAKRPQSNSPAARETVRRVPGRVWLALLALWALGGAATGWLAYRAWDLAQIAGLDCWNEETWKEYRKCSEQAENGAWAWAVVVCILGTVILGVLSRWMIRSSTRQEIP